MRPGSGQRATETRLNPARGSRARGGATRAASSGRTAPGSGLPPCGPASAASGARWRGDPGPSQRARPSLLQARAGVSPQASHSGGADGLCGLPPLRDNGPAYGLPLVCSPCTSPKLSPRREPRGEAGPRRTALSSRARSEAGLCPAPVVARDFGGFRLGGPCPEPSARLRAISARGAPGPRGPGSMAASFLLLLAPPGPRRAWGRTDTHLGVERGGGAPATQRGAFPPHLCSGWAGVGDGPPTHSLDPLGWQAPARFSFSSTVFSASRCTLLNPCAGIPTRGFWPSQRPETGRRGGEGRGSCSAFHKCLQHRLILASFAKTKRPPSVPLGDFCDI